MNTVLVVEDDHAIRHFVRHSLESDGLRVVEAGNLAEAREQLRAERPELLILDLGLPDGDGIDLIRELRQWSEMPVLVLSARFHEMDKVLALDAGGDDYLAKPFGVAEFLARVRVLLRRHAQRDSGQVVFRFGEVVVDLAERRVSKAGELIRLTPVEFNLLVCLLKRPGQVITQRQLLNTVWGPGNVDRGHYLRIYVGRLRHKLEIDPAQPVHLITETGVGYRFMP